MKRKPHVFSWFVKYIGRWTCPYCGLVQLRNAATQRAIARGCDGQDE